MDEPDWKRWLGRALAALYASQALAIGVMAVSADQGRVDIALGVPLLGVLARLARGRDRSTAAVLTPVYASAWAILAFAPHYRWNPTWLGQADSVAGWLVALDWAALGGYALAVALGHALDRRARSVLVLFERQRATLTELSRWLGWTCLLEAGGMLLALHGSGRASEQLLLAGVGLALLVAWHLGRRARLLPALLAASPGAAALGFVGWAVGQLADDLVLPGALAPLIFPALNLGFALLGFLGLLPMALRVAALAARPPLALPARRPRS